MTLLFHFFSDCPYHILRDHFYPFLWSRSLLATQFFSLPYFRFDLLVPLGTPLLGTTVEVKDANGSAILEGEGQVFIGDFSI